MKFFNEKLKVYQKFLSSWVSSEHILSLFIINHYHRLLNKEKIRTQKLLKLDFNQIFYIFHFPAETLRFSGRVVNDSKFLISRGLKRSVFFFKRLNGFYDILAFDFRLFRHVGRKKIANMKGRMICLLLYMILSHRIFLAIMCDNL